MIWFFDSLRRQTTLESDYPRIYSLALNIIYTFVKWSCTQDERIMAGSSALQQTSVMIFNIDCGILKIPYRYLCIENQIYKNYGTHK